MTAPDSRPTPRTDALQGRLALVVYDHAKRIISGELVIDAIAVATTDVADMECELREARVQADKYWTQLCQTVEALGKVAPEAAPYSVGWAANLRAKLTRVEEGLERARVDFNYLANFGTAEDWTEEPGHTLKTMHESARHAMERVAAAASIPAPLPAWRGNPASAAASGPTDTQLLDFHIAHMCKHGMKFSREDLVASYRTQAT